MNILPIYTFDHPILRKTLATVTEITDELVGLTIDMHATMHGADGIGLAANQVGHDLAMTVINISGVEGCEKIPPMTVINPVIVSYSDEEESYEEGCLSLPELRADVVRPIEVAVRYYDLDMKEHTVEADGLLARVLQHEIDHLHGIYFFDHLKPMRRTMLRRRLLEIKRREVETDYPLYDITS